MTDEYACHIPTIMQLDVYREPSDGVRTFGTLYIDGVKLCETLEDPPQDTKIYGETRIDAATYAIEYNFTGKMNELYRAKYGSFHKGMLEICDVANFTYIYIHIGNFETDTLGCLLVGMGRTSSMITRSTEAYIALYELVSSMLDKGGVVRITFHDGLYKG